MIAKVRNNGLIKIAAMTALLYLSCLPAGHTAENMLGGSVIQATPYDNRLDASGAFSGTAGSVLGSLRPSDDLFMRARSIRYVADAKGNDYWQSPQETQARWSGDCEDKALWLFAELKKNGHSNVRLVVGRFRSTGGYHVWVTMGDAQGNVWVLDPTAQKKIWKASDFGPGYYKALYSFDGINRYRHDA
jgi:hypothetical protein